MIDEEKQPNNTVEEPTTNESVTQSADAQGIESATTEAQVSGNADIASQESQGEQVDEALGTSSAAEDQAQSSASEAIQAISDEEQLAEIEQLRQDYQVLQAKLDELSQQGESFKNQYARIAADFDNFRKRTAKEKEDLEYQIKRATLTEILPVVDNFERARSQIKPQNDGEMAIHKSYQGVYKQLVDSFKRLGVAPMRPEEKEFDPNFHEAVMQEATDEYPEGTVIEQLQRGYFLNERVLRHAMVKVATAPEPMVTSEEETSQEES